METLAVTVHSDFADSLICLTNAEEPSSVFVADGERNFSYGEVFGI